MPLMAIAPEEIEATSKKHKLAISENLRRLRNQRGMSQSDVAQSIGVEQPTISNAELAKTIPSGDTLAALCVLFETTPAEIYSTA